MATQKSGWGPIGHINVPDGWPAQEEYINLDTAPIDRWNDVGKKYGADIRASLAAIKESAPDIIPEWAFKLADGIGALLNSILPAPYADEMRGLAKAAGVPVGELFLVNVGYDITARCTSIVAQAEDGTLLHARNLDVPSEGSSFLNVSRKSTFTGHFTRGGQTVYSGVVNAGGIGLPTGQKPHSFAITLNERRTGSIWENFLGLLFDQPGSGILFRIRDTLADADMTYQGAVQKMAHVNMIAACYITISGTQPGEGAVITRDRTGPAKPLTAGIWKLNPTEGTWYLLQANNDHWTAPPTLEPIRARDGDSYARQQAGRKAMEEMGRSNLSPQGLMNVLSTQPVFNVDTLYTTIMTAAEPSVNTTWVRDLTVKSK